ncbi:MAG: TIGR00266 family protein [Spirochaetales bacterium]|nr:TIGR00266 family protein [Spirochaetales bacterium]
MKYSIENGPAFTTLKVELASGEDFRSEGGAMVGMSSGIDLKTETSGKGILGIIKSMFSGEGMFVSSYSGTGEVYLAPPTPGDIMAYDLGGKTLYAQNGAYLAGSSDLTLSAKGSMKAMISGEDLFLQKITGQGTVFLNSYGVIIEKELAAGESYRVDTGHIVAFEEGVNYSVRKASKSIISSFLSKEGLVCEFQGPGKLYFQNRDLKGFAKLLKSLTQIKKS